MAPGKPDFDISADQAPEPGLHGLGRQGNSSNCADTVEEELLCETHNLRKSCATARRIIIKVGSSVVTRHHDERLALGRIGALIEVVEALIRSGRQVILVTSGAAAVGSQKLRYQLVMNSSPLQMQMRANDEIPPHSASAAGQSGLMKLYDKMFQMMDMLAAQFLVTENDFDNEQFKESTRVTVDALLNNLVVPIFNTNDAVSGEPMAGGDGAYIDNDGLAVRLQELLDADLMVLLTDVDGIYTGPPDAPDSRLIHTFCPDVHNSLFCFPSQETNSASSDTNDAKCTSAGLPNSHVTVDEHGSAGTRSKVAAAWRTALRGATALVLNGTQPVELMSAISGEKVGTLFHKEAATEVAGRELNAYGLDENTVPDMHAGNNADNTVTVDTGDIATPETIAKAAREQGRILANLPGAEKAAFLVRIADALEGGIPEIMAANDEDMANAQDTLEPNLLQRLKMSPVKIHQLAAGIRQLADQEDPLKHVLSRQEIAEDLILEKLTCPLGVFLVIFESRPDSLPQIAALAIRSGNGLLLRGGREATQTNRCLHSIIISSLPPKCTSDLIALVERRDDIDDLLAMHEYIDLIIPRGSNQLVAYVQQHTKIPVLGHCEGICNMYIDAEVDMAQACRVCVDSKADYPVACNAIEKILLHRSHLHNGGIFQLQSALHAADVTIYGSQAVEALLGVQTATYPLRREYLNMEVTIDVVDDIAGAIDQIHAYGSSHTDCICTSDEANADLFLRSVDSACVIANASSRFSDGYRFGLGAEVAISTGRIHARGPVGVQGLMTSRYVLRGKGQIVANDTGVTYTHRPLRADVSLAEAVLGATV